MNFGPLTPEFTLIIWQPLRRQMGEIGETRSLAFHNGWQEPTNGFAPNSHGRRVWSFALISLNVNVKGQGQQRQKTRCALTTSKHRPNTMHSLQITSRKQQTRRLRRYHRCRGVTLSAYVCWAWRATAGLCHAFLVCIWSSCCHCHPIISGFIKIQNGISGASLTRLSYEFLVCLLCFWQLCSCADCFCCVRFSFFSTKPRNWLGRTSLKLPILCQVGCKTLTQSINQGSDKLRCRMDFQHEFWPHALPDMTVPTYFDDSRNQTQDQHVTNSFNN